MPSRVGQRKGVGSDRTFFEEVTGKGDLPIKGSCKSCLAASLGRALSPCHHARPYREPLVGELLDPGAVVLLDDLGQTVVGQRAALEAYGVPPVAVILREVLKGSRENRKQRRH